jgi:ATP-binding cassette subfamily B (MDR/TAP) protein 1
MILTPPKRSFDSLEDLQTLYNSMNSLNPNTQQAGYEFRKSEPLKETASQIDTPSWRSLFHFTTRRHLPRLWFTLTVTAISSCVHPAGAIIYGKVFSLLIRFGAGTLTGSDTLSQMKTLCIAFVTLGIMSWCIESWFLGLWLTFGEIQAKRVREQMFTSMLQKDMDWYDTREDGIGSLLVRIET